MTELFAFPLVVIVSTLTAFVVFLIAKLTEFVECKCRQKMKVFMSCNTCPIKNTEYCHLVNPEAKKLTRQEKEKIAEMLKRRTTELEESTKELEQ